MSRILLVNPPKEVPVLDWTMRYPPLGLMSIAGVLDGHEVEILDMKVERGATKALGRKLGSVDIVGVTALTPSIDSALEICGAARESGALTVLGGVHPSLMPNVAGRPEVDIVVRGEGEYSFKEIADGRPVGSVAGISYAGGSEVVHNPDRPPAKLDMLPPPRRDLVSRYEKKYRAFGRKLDAVSTTRGCPFRCSFCCVPAVWKGYRELSPARVVDEIKRIRASEIVSIVDDNFCQDMGRVEEICDLIIREGLNDRLYSVFSRVESIVRHPGVVEKMALANMRVVFIGVEAASQEALDRMNKKTRIGDVHRACEILEENGMLVWAGHIIGNLDDTYDDVEALIRMSGRLPVDIAQFTVITPYPGTDLYRVAREKDLIDELDFTSYYECEPAMHTEHLSRMEIMELQIKAYMKFYGFRAMRGRAARWSKKPQKKWLIDDNLKGIRSFWKFRDRSARYFWRAYREMVGKTQGTRIRRYSPLFSTPKLYSVGAGIVAAALTFLITVYAERYYGRYSARGLGFVVADLLFAAVLVAFVTAVVCTLLAIRSYRKGWIFSVRRRKPAKARWSPARKAIANAALYSVAALVLAVILIVVVSAGWSASRITYGVKEVLVTTVAFMTALLVSHGSVSAVRNGSVPPLQ
jgi:anaerobic magnesium-protoporphyrin IX monomethyl ester cyclase